MAHDPKTDHGVLEETRDKTQKPTLYKVILLNDDYTTMEFVVQVLEEVFHKTPAEAYRIMMRCTHKDTASAVPTVTRWPKPKSLRPRTWRGAMVSRSKRP